MASLIPPPYGVAFAFDVVLFAQSDGQIKTSPTIASGDFVIAKASGTGDMGATANLTTAPSEIPASSGIVKVSLSATEMEADRVLVRWKDASGGEWHSGAYQIFTSGQTFDTIEGLIDDLESRLTATRAGYLDNLSAGAAALESTAQTILADTNELQTDWANGGRLDLILDEAGGSGATPAQLWSYGTRTLTAATVAGPGTEIDGGDITAVRGDSLSVSLSALGNVTARTKLWFTAKRSHSHADTEAIIQIVESTGLTLINGTEAATAGNGALTVTDTADGDMTLTLAAVETAKIATGGSLAWDIQMLTASGVTTLAVGTITFSADVTRATS